MTPAPAYALGLDVGGTTVKAGRITAEGAVTASTMIPSHADRSPEALLGQVLAAIGSMLADDGGRGCAGIGVGIPGIVSAADGLVRYPPNFTGWGEVDVRGALERETGRRVVVENDANCAALAEARFGAGRRHADFLFVIWGTGVGGGIILGGRIYRGPGGGAGEFGHVSIDRDGPACRCGNRGCVESYIGQRYLSERAREAVEREPGGGGRILALAGGDPSRIEPELLSRAAAEGDPLAGAMLREAGGMLGAALASVVNITDIPAAVVGGGISAAPDFVFEAAAAEMRSRVLTSHRPAVSVERAELGNQAGMIGAASLVR